MNYDPNTGQPINNQQPYQPVQQQSQTNGFAIAGLIVAILVSAVIGLILSIVGLSKAKKTNSGKGIAIAGIIISVLKLIAELLVVLLVGGLFATLFGAAINQETYCSMAYECGEPNEYGYASCKYKSDKGYDITISCPATTTKKTTTTTTTTAVAGTVQEFNITDDFQDDAYYAKKFFLKDYKLYAVPTELGKKYVKTGSTVNGVACAEIVLNIEKAFVVEAGQAGMQQLIIVDKTGQAYRVVNYTNDNESTPFDFVKIPNAKPISKVYSILVPDAISAFYLNTDNQLVPTGDGYLEIDKKNGYYENKVGSDVYKVEYVKRDTDYVYFNIYKNKVKIAENIKIQDNDGLANYDDVDGIFIAMCSGNKFGVDCN